MFDLVSIPLEQGGVFRQMEIENIHIHSEVSIPLEQGGVFRRDIHLDALLEDEFQSLWSRAGSFDKMEQFKDRVIAAFQSL